MCVHVCACVRSVPNALDDGAADLNDGEEMVALVILDNGCERHTMLSIKGWVYRHASDHCNAT